MSIEHIVREKMNNALKCGDKKSRTVYSSIINALTNKAKELQVSELEHEQEIEVITKLVKQNKESIDTCPDSRVDILDKLNFERNILMEYMPKQMSEDEIISVIDAVVHELGISNPTQKDKGRIMKDLMPKVKGKADGKLVNKLLIDKLS